MIEGALALLPLAALCDVPERMLPDIVDQMRFRINSEIADHDPSSLWVEFDLLLGLKYPQDFVQSLLKGAGNMQESSTFRAILAEGEARGIALGEARGVALGEARGKRDSILRLGSRRFGEPDAAVRTFLDKIDSLERLDHLVARLLDAESWNDLLGN